MIKPITTPGKTYAVTSPNGCTVTQHVGEVDIVTDVPAGLQTLIIAHASKFEIDDDSAIVTECGGSAELVFTAATTRAASSGTGSDGMTAEERALLNGAAQRDADNTFSAGNTFTGAVDMSGASVTPPDGWNVAELTPEAIQQVVPMAWSAWATPAEVKYVTSIALGEHAWAHGNGTTALGVNTGCYGSYSTSVGNFTTVQSFYTTAIGAYYYDGSSYIRTTSEAPQTVVVGNGAQILNSTDANGNTVQSSNSVAIGCNALNKGADSVVIGAQAKGLVTPAIAIGVESKVSGVGGISIGKNSWTLNDAVHIGNSGASEADAIAIGVASNAKFKGVALGRGAKTLSNCGTAIGYYATVYDIGATVIRSTAEDGTYTQLYFSGANTPLANTYEDGEAMMGYVVRDSAGNVMTDAEGNAMVGTQKLSVLFPNNRGENAFTPAMLGLDDEWTPKPMFRPSDLDLPNEEPAEPEEYQPLPVYPIVEPEIPEMEEV